MDRGGRFCEIAVFYTLILYRLFLTYFPYMRLASHLLVPCTVLPLCRGFLLTHIQPSFFLAARPPRPAFVQAVSYYIFIGSKVS